MNITYIISLIGNKLCVGKTYNHLKDGEKVRFGYSCNRRDHTLQNSYQGIISHDTKYQNQENWEREICIAVHLRDNSYLILE